MKRHLNDTRQPVLTDDLLLSWHLDPGIITRHGHIVADEDPLVTNSVGSWTNRPTANTGIPNLLLAGDYVQADFDITSMETANEAARRAVNALLDHAGSTTAPCHVFPRNLPPEWNTLRALDDDRYQRGQANVLESPLPATELGSLLTRLSNL
jgi:hypothetical protein